MSERTDADLIREALTRSGRARTSLATGELEQKALAALDRLVAERDRHAEALRQIRAAELRHTVYSAGVPYATRIARPEEQAAHMRGIAAAALAGTAP